MKVEVRTSLIEGKGVFTTENIGKGEVVLDWSKLPEISDLEFEKLSKHEQSHAPYVGNNCYVVVGEPEQYINHSCDPNTYVSNQTDIALRDIVKGEEITSDYDLISINRKSMNCFCGAKNCRGVVMGDFRLLSKDVQQQKAPLLQDWFKKEISL